MEDEILKRYFKDKMRQIDIAIELNISKYKVSRVVTKDSRYNKEKERRKLSSEQKHKEKTIDYIKSKRRTKIQDEVYQQLQQLHRQASQELSGRKTISNIAYRNWNTSAYKYNDKTKSYHLRNGIIAGFDVPRKIKWKNY